MEGFEEFYAFVTPSFSGQRQQPPISVGEPSIPASVDSFMQQHLPHGTYFAPTQGPESNSTLPTTDPLSIDDGGRPDISSSLYQYETFPSAVERNFEIVGADRSNEAHWFPMEEPLGLLDPQIYDLASDSPALATWSYHGSHQLPNRQTAPLPIATSYHRQPYRVVRRDRSRRKGRSRKLSVAEREAAAHMRVIGNCPSCVKRKCKCDPGIPCRACIVHYKDRLPKNPCRQQIVPYVCDLLLADTVKWHPSVHLLGPFVEQDCYELPYVYNIAIHFGSFSPMVRQVRALHTDKLDRLIHDHCVYPPIEDSRSIGYHTEQSWVLPAIFQETHDLEADFELYFRDRVDHEFGGFQCFESPLHVLSPVHKLYMHYRQTSSPYAPVLASALTLLLVVHMGGQPYVLTTDASVQALFSATLGPCNGQNVSACFLRAGLGAVMPSVAKKLLGSVLQSWQILVLGRRSEHFPICLATLSVLLMVVETIQFHGAKDGLHSPSRDHATRSAVFSEHSRSLIASSQNGEQSARVLLRMHEVCYENMHCQIVWPVSTPASSLSSSPSPMSTQVAHDFNHPIAEKPSSSSSSLSSAAGSFQTLPRDPGAKFVTEMRDIVRAARPYIEQKAGLEVNDVQHMSQFFDRLLARLYILR